MRPALLALTTLALTAAGCPGPGDRPAPAERERGDAGAGDAPRVTPDGGGLILTWVDDEGAPHVASAVSEIPEERRGVVRVQDPAGRPLPAGQVWLADLRQVESGSFPVRLAPRSELEALARPRQAPAPAEQAPAAEAPSPTAQPGERPRVVMYVTSTCPVCRRARSWLSRNHVSFVERDIGRDPVAARALEQAAARAGVRANGVPVFDVNGTVIAGFDQARLARVLGI